MILLITFCITISIYLYFTYSFNYWKKKHIPYLEPNIPLGNANLAYYRKFGQELAKLHRKFRAGNKKYGGFFMATKPLLLILDPDLIKSILIKDFQYFYDRGIYHNQDEPITEHLFAISGPNWKKLRTKLSPIFSPNKLKTTVELIKISATDFELSLKDRNGPIDIKKLCSMFTTKVICNSAFGIEDSNEKFYEMGKDLITNNFAQSLKNLLVFSAPKLMKKFNLKFIKKAFDKFFSNAIRNVVNYREQNNIDRTDIMNLLIKLKNNKSIADDNNINKTIEGITMNELIANCFIFFVGGWETSASALTYCMFELSQNLYIQSKLRNEINTVLKKYNNQVTYEAIMDMEYLEQVISETLRKYPSVVALNRKCMKDYKIPNTDVTIEENTLIFISTLGLHHDETYFPNPENFDPERFSEQEKQKRHPYSFLPFGEGPKNCIGLRYGILQTKCGIIYLLRKHKFSLNSKTKLPLEFISEAILLNHYGTIWLNVEKL